MSNVATYEEVREGFDWALGERELGYTPGGAINVGWHCSDRICALGRGDRLALGWEDFQGNQRRYTFDDLRVLSNTIAVFLRELGIGPGERVCLFLDRVPELYIGILAILKLGAIAQPLFSAFGDEALASRVADAGTAAIITQRKHAAKVRKVRDQLPELRHLVIVDAGDAVLRAGEVAMTLDALPRVNEFEVYPTMAESPSLLHYTSARRARRRGRSTSTTR